MSIIDPRDFNVKTLIFNTSVLGIALLFIQWNSNIYSPGVLLFILILFIVFLIASVMKSNYDYTLVRIQQKLIPVYVAAAFIIANVFSFFWLLNSCK
ncbi:MAG TPA: hypothetical protein VK796_01865 [Cytophaga sp.]|nr:hypothetical protein [Cytophaga sp.]